MSHLGRQLLSASGLGMVTKFMVQCNSGQIFSWSFNTSLKCFISSVSFPISFFREVFSCSRDSYSSWSLSAFCVCFFRLLCAATRFFSLLLTFLSSSSWLPAHSWPRNTCDIGFPKRHDLRRMGRSARRGSLEWGRGIGAGIKRFSLSLLARFL